MWSENGASGSSKGSSSEVTTVQQSTKEASADSGRACRQRAGFMQKPEHSQSTGSPVGAMKKTSGITSTDASSRSESA